MSKNRPKVFIDFILDIRRSKIASKKSFSTGNEDQI